MGREVRRVPPNWKHPRYDEGPNTGEFKSCNDEDYETASKRWEADFASFMRGEHKACEYGSIRHFWEWESPPDEETCRPAFTEPATWFQVYQTVSEGSPVTPPFATEEALIDWLVEQGESHGTKYEKKYTRAAASAFVKAGSAPSMVVSSHGVLTGIGFMGLTEE